MSQTWMTRAEAEKLRDEIRAAGYKSRAVNKLYCAVHIYNSRGDKIKTITSREEWEAWRATDLRPPKYTMADALPLLEQAIAQIANQKKKTPMDRLLTATTKTIGAKKS